MNKSFILIFTLFLVFISSEHFASCNIQPQSSKSLPSLQLSSSQQASLNVPFSKCLKNYSMKYDDLFLHTVSAINLNNFKILEMQSRNSKIIFQAYSREFVATIDKMGSNQSSLKIVPANNNYTFSYEILQRIFNTIDMNKTNKPIKV